MLLYNGKASSDWSILLISHSPFYAVFTFLFIFRVWLWFFFPPFELYVKPFTAVHLITKQTNKEAYEQTNNRKFRVLNMPLETASKGHCYSVNWSDAIADIGCRQLIFLEQSLHPSTARAFSYVHILRLENQAAHGMPRDYTWLSYQNLLLLVH